MIDPDISLDWSGFKSYLVRIEVMINLNKKSWLIWIEVLIDSDLSLDWSGLKSWLIRILVLIDPDW